MVDLGLKLGINPFSSDSAQNSIEMDKWYQLYNHQVIDNGGSGLVAKFHGSLPALVKAVFPSQQWDDEKFAEASKRFWSSMENQREFMLDLGKKLGFNENDRTNWYKVSKEVVLENGGSGLLAYYNGSLANAIVATFPDFHWDLKEFGRAPRNYWSSRENQRSFMVALGKKLGFKDGDMFPWYQISHRTLNENGGSGCLEKYNGSIPALLAAVFSEHRWDIWRFPRRNVITRNDPQAVSELIQSVEKTLGITKPCDWHRVSSEQLEMLDLGRVFRRHRGGLVAVLRARYPEEDWQRSPLARRTTSSVKV